MSTLQTYVVTMKDRDTGGRDFETERKTSKVKGLGVKGSFLEPVPLRFPAAPDSSSDRP